MNNLAAVKNLAVIKRHVIGWHVVMNGRQTLLSASGLKLHDSFEVSGRGEG